MFWKLVTIFKLFFGPKSDTLKGQIQDIMNGKTPVVTKEETKTIEKPVATSEVGSGMMVMILFHRLRENWYLYRKYQNQVFSTETNG